MKKLLELALLHGYGLHFTNAIGYTGIYIQLTLCLDGNLKVVDSKIVPWDHYSENYCLEVLRYMFDKLENPTPGQII